MPPKKKTAPKKTKKQPEKKKKIKDDSDTEEEESEEEIEDNKQPGTKKESQEQFIERKRQELFGAKFNLWNKITELENLVATEYNKYVNNEEMKLFDLTTVLVHLTSAKARILSDNIKFTPK